MCNTNDHQPFSDQFQELRSLLKSHSSANLMFISVGKANNDASVSDNVTSSHGCVLDKKYVICTMLLILSVA